MHDFDELVLRAQKELEAGFRCKQYSSWSPNSLRYPDFGPKPPFSRLTRWKSYTFQYFSTPCSPKSLKGSSQDHNKKNQIAPEIDSRDTDPPAGFGDADWFFGTPSWISRDLVWSTWISLAGTLGSLDCIVVFNKDQWWVTTVTGLRLARKWNVK